MNLKLCVVNGLLHFVNIMKAYPLAWDWSAHRKEHLFVAHLPTRALSVIHWKGLYLLPVLLIMSCDYWSKEYSWIHALTHMYVMGSRRQELQSNFSLFCWVLQIGHLISSFTSWRCISYSSPCCSNQVHENTNKLQRASFKMEQTVAFLSECLRYLSIRVNTRSWM